MEEIDKLKRAKMYMEKLSQGIDPITDIELPADTVLNNVRLCRCFFYVAGVLGKLIDKRGDEALAQTQDALPQSDAAIWRASFSVTKEQAASVPIEKEPIEISALCKKLNALIDNRYMKKLVATKVTNWLLREGYLQEKPTSSGRNVRLPSEQGRALGISFERYYTYKMKYNENAQRFVLDHMEEITRPTENTWGHRWQNSKASSSWEREDKSGGRSYAEVAWKDNTSDVD